VDRTPIEAQHDAFTLFWCVLVSREDYRAEMQRYRHRIQDAAPARVKIAMACVHDGLAASTAMKLLNMTIEEEREVAG